MAIRWKVHMDVGSTTIDPFEYSGTCVNCANGGVSSLVRVIIDDADYPACEKEIIQIIQSLLPKLKSNKIQLAIENHDSLSTHTLKHIV